MVTDALVEHRGTPGRTYFRRAGIQFTSAMARTSLLVALALAAAPFTAHALGVVDTPCPCASFFDVDLDFGVPKGECGDKEFVPCAGFFQCELPGWEFNEDLPSCDDSEVDCKDRGGDWGFFGGECCGKCSIPP